MKELAQKRLVQLLDQQQADIQAQKQRQTQQQVKRQLQVTKDGAAVEGSEEAQNDARLRTGCYFPAAVALNGPTVTPDKLVATFHELQAGTGFAQKDIENRLAVQITTLDFMFYDLLTRSHSAPNIDKASRLIELAMRCQEQSRRTITTLDNIRNPKKPSQFIKNYVDKQVNQLKVEQESHAATSLEASPYAAMDTRSTAATARTDTDLAAVAVINGTNQC
ncbi:hypothetical protein H6F86_00495 [Phormidium sp. FACHB-592]|uniref:Uncharacterized protein n=1 Tax=Stenomitos frigidus AS-A4 TaxID=2933935 RepID=A0ABV0KT96_9CYAN|nr:hypothetical protein [Phormidium sp. FACHB-592]MBD2072413.1 hypothetical protein [Phormidium sp. FACHB-592]